MLKYARGFAFDPEDAPDTAFQKQLLAIISFFLLLCGCTWTFMYYSIYGMSVPVYSSFAYVINALVAGYIAHKTKNHLILVYAIFYASSAAPFIAQWSAGSLNEGAMVIIWGFLTPLGVLIFTSLRPAIIGMLVFVVCILITTIVEPKFGPPLAASEGMIKFMFSMNLVVSLSVNFATSAWFVFRFKMEKKKSDSLLLNILPSEVAQELKTYGKVEPISHENATVLFTDFKGFTEISESISPKELVAEINYCFAAFDEITTRYNIEKIKTIGDSYMAVGGNFGKKECTPWHVVSAGLEMRDFIMARKIERDKEGKFGFQMRVGVHSGPIISGVVGVKKFQFDIWGDTVNIASRMESNGKINELNISEVTYNLIKDKFEFEERGTLPVKGKGNMQMYFVEPKGQAVLA